MVKVTFFLKDYIDEQFRKIVAKRKGLHRGVLTESFEEAILDWMKRKKR